MMREGTGGIAEALEKNYVFLANRIEADNMAAAFGRSLEANLPVIRAVQDIVAPIVRQSELRKNITLRLSKANKACRMGIIVPEKEF